MKIRLFSIGLIALLYTQPGANAQVVTNDARANEVIELLAQAVTQPAESVEQSKEDLLRQQQDLRRQIETLQRMMADQQRKKEDVQRLDEARSLRSNNAPSSSDRFSTWHGQAVIETQDLPAIDWEKDADAQIRVFPLQYAPVEQILPMVQKLFSGKLNIFRHPTNQGLIVVGDESGFKLFEEVLRTLDTKPLEPEPIQTADMALRVYAIENQPLQDADKIAVERFVLEIDGEGNLNINRLLSLTNASFSIDSLNQVKENTYVVEMHGYEKGISGKVCTLIEEELGVPVSLKQVDVKGETDELNLQSIPIPSNVQPTLKNLLGSNLYVTGYWFGNTSMPGTVEAPLGDWKLVMESADGQDDGFRLDVSVFSNQGGGQQMSNFSMPPRSGSSGASAPAMSGGSG
ncbi:hypothetical protein K8I31_02280, partial [bacterium]|nr:hypothetical protein [bacterium]